MLDLSESKVQPKPPAWLPKSFRDAAVASGASAGRSQITAEADRLLDKWNAPGRHFHNAKLLAKILSAFDTISECAHDPDLARLAIWYGGAFLTRSVHDDEARIQVHKSVCVREVVAGLRTLGVPEVDRVVQLVSYMFALRAPREDTDANALIDAQMSVLAAVPQEYKKYRVGARAECPAFSDFAFEVSRRRFVLNLLKRKTIFRSPNAGVWEDPARQNLEAELANLDAAIAKVDPDFTDEPAGGVVDDEEPTSGTLVIRRSVKKPPRKTRESSESTESSGGASTSGNRPTSDRASEQPANNRDGGGASGDASKNKPEDANTREADAGDQSASSLESEPDFLKPAPKPQVKRKTAKEQARESAKQQAFKEQARDSAKQQAFKEQARESAKQQGTEPTGGQARSEAAKEQTRDSEVN
ncbi:hypothetical protein QS713_08240 [Gleimia hominis]|uniref:Uncharacterized protein n=1 Tax=Gleimia hominis TaxID=595468 RepID=A0ABU3ICD1_9ACTO|nr:hypothetical protein [Gleimia hominis]MDT3768044.1 hypothetical protein [Gleimia hominis]